MTVLLNGGAHGCLESCPKCKKGCPICHPCDPREHSLLPPREARSLIPVKNIMPVPPSRSGEDQRKTVPDCQHIFRGLASDQSREGCVNCRILRPRTTQPYSQSDEWLDEALLLLIQDYQRRRFLRQGVREAADRVIPEAKQAILAELNKREAAARVSGASDYVAETYGKRCEVKDYDDFPELKDDPLANRCLTCEEWDRFDRWAAQLHKEQPEGEDHDPN